MSWELYFVCILKKKSKAINSIKIDSLDGALLRLCKLLMSSVVLCVHWIPINADLSMIPAADDDRETRKEMKIESRQIMIL